MSKGLTATGAGQTGNLRPTASFLQAHPEFIDDDFRRAYFLDQLRVTVAVELRKARKARGLTQLDVAVAADMGQEQVVRAEDPDKWPGMTLRTLVRLADGIGLVPRIIFEEYQDSLEGEKK